MIPAGGTSVNTNASAPIETRQTGGGIFVGGLNTGTQGGLDTKTLAIIGVVVIVVVLVIWRRR